MSIPPEILKKVKLLEMKTRKMVNNLFAGQYHSAFKGQGMTFSEFREYVPGDDVRSIAWPLMARTGKPYIKKFDEERELTLLLAVDVSGSTDFGGGEYLKGEVMTHLSALLGFSAVKNNDAVGLLLFSDQVEHFVPPKKGRGHILRILRDLYYYKPKSRRTKISVALDFMLGVLKKRSNIFVFSDFLDEGFEHSLRRLGQKHDTVACVVSDALEKEVPNLGLVEVEDAETGEFKLVDTSSYYFQKKFSEIQHEKQKQRERMLLKSQVDAVYVDSQEKDITAPLVSYFKKRG